MAIEDNDQNDRFSTINRRGELATADISSIPLTNKTVLSTPWNLRRSIYSLIIWGDALLIPHRPLLCISLDRSPAISHFTIHPYAKMATENKNRSKCDNQDLGEKDKGDKTRRILREKNVTKRSAETKNRTERADSEVSRPGIATTPTVAMWKSV